MNKYLMLAVSLSGMALCSSASSVIVHTDGGQITSVEDGTDNSNSKCSPSETASFTLTINGTEKGVVEAKAALDKEFRELSEKVEKEHFTRFEIESYNMNITNGGRISSYFRRRNIPYRHDNNSDSSATYNGTIRLSLLPVDKALEFKKFLADKGYTVVINITSSSNANCDSTPAAWPVN